MTNPEADWEDFYQRIHPDWPRQTLDAHTLNVDVPHANEEIQVTCSVERGERGTGGNHDWYAADYPFPFATPAHRYAAIGELLHLINGEGEYPECVFCLNYQTGQVTCTSRHFCTKSGPDDHWLDKIVKSVVEAVIRYRPGLIATAYHDVAPRLALPLSAMDEPLIPPSDSPDVWWV